jgi:hypothetical protein
MFASLSIAASAVFLSMPAAVAAPLAGSLALGDADAAAVLQVNGTQQHRRAHRTHRTHRGSANRNRSASDHTAYERSGYNYGANVGSWGPGRYGYGGGPGWDNAYGSYGFAPPYGGYGYGASPYGSYGYGSYGYGGPGSAYDNYGRGCIHGTPSEVSSYPSWAVCESR